MQQIHASRKILQVLARNKFSVFLGTVELFCYFSYLLLSSIKVASETRPHRDVHAKIPFDYPEESEPYKELEEKQVKEPNSKADTPQQSPNTKQKRGQPITKVVITSIPRSSSSLVGMAFAELSENSFYTFEPLWDIRRTLRPDKRKEYTNLAPFLLDRFD